MTTRAPVLTFSSPGATAVCVRTESSASSQASTQLMPSLDRRCRSTVMLIHRQLLQVELPASVAHRIWDMIPMVAATRALHGSISRQTRVQPPEEENLWFKPWRHSKRATCPPSSKPSMRLKLGKRQGCRSHRS